MREIPRRHALTCEGMPADVPPPCLVSPDFTSLRGPGLVSLLCLGFELALVAPPSPVSAGEPAAAAAAAACCCCW